MSESKTETADKRVQRSKEAVLGVTYKLLSEGGIGGVSIDEVSRRSGVSKTTIYRHWPSRSALLLEACSKIGTPPEVPDTGSLLGDVTALLPIWPINFKTPGGRQFYRRLSMPRNGIPNLPSCMPGFMPV